MPFWTVEDAGPYEENTNILMRILILTVPFSLQNKKGVA